MDDPRPEDDALLNYVDSRGWFAMVTEWLTGPQPRAMAFVACGPDGAQRCYDAAAETSTAALGMAIGKARSIEDFGPNPPATAKS
jgi:hypothetical protein